MWDARVPVSGVEPAVHAKGITSVGASLNGGMAVTASLDDTVKVSSNEINFVRALPCTRRVFVFVSTAWCGILRTKSWLCGERMKDELACAGLGKLC